MKNTITHTEWQDPKIVEINRLKPRASFFALQRDSDQFVSLPWDFSNFLLLNGEWHFHYCESPKDRPRTFFEPEFDVSGWDVLDVPANWQLNGYGVPNYRNHRVDFDRETGPPLVPTEVNPVGSYKRNFQLPDDWAGDRVFIYFGAVKSAYYVWINGHIVGYAQDSKCPSEFEITDYVEAGNNQIAIQVYRWCDGTFLEVQDMWRMSGITRDIYIYSTPKTRIQDFHAKSSLDANYQHGGLALSVSIDFDFESVQTEYTLAYTVFDENQNSILTDQTQINSNSTGSTDVTFANTLPNVKPWSAEKPNLYQLKLTLLDDKGVLQQVVWQRLGFRVSELKGGNVLINGKAVLFKGVNRHEHDPISGHVISRESMREDMALLKHYNINAVRTAHYPNDPYWYELADEFGIYLVDEANLESHGIGAANQDIDYDPALHMVNMPAWRDAYIHRIQNVYERDKNHASVVIWSIGNESGDGPNIEAMYDWLKRRTELPVMSEQAQLRRHTDIYSQMYASIDTLKHYAELGESRPAILCEYEHAMGNSMGNLHDYWQIIEVYPLLQGGFIWDWVDQTFPLENDQGVKYWGYGGDLETADMYHDGNFSANGVLAADRSPNPHAHEVKAVYQNYACQWADDTHTNLTIMNKCFFSDMTHIAVCWHALANGKEVANGTLEKVNVAPQETKSVDFEFDLAFEANVEYLVTFSFIQTQASPGIKTGHVLAKTQLPLFGSASSLLGLNGRLDSQTEQAIIVIQDDDVLVVQADETTLRFDKHNGFLQQYQVAQIDVLVDALRPEFWRAPTDNDFGEGFAEKARDWRFAARHTTLTRFDVISCSESEVKIASEHYLQDVESRYLVTYTLDAAANLHMDIWFYAAPHKFHSQLPRIGSLLQLHEQFDDVSWYGRGPHENYVDRHQSALIGQYQSRVEDLYFPYVRPQENGYRTDVREVSFVNQAGVGVRFSGQPLLCFGAQKYDIHDYDQFKKSGKHPHDLPKKDRIFVNVDYRQRGVGGTDSWGSSPLFNYCLPWRDYHYQMVISPVKT